MHFPLTQAHGMSLCKWKINPIAEQGGIPVNPNIHARTRMFSRDFFDLLKMLLEFGEIKFNGNGT